MALYLDDQTAHFVALLAPLQEVTLLGFDVVKVADVALPGGRLAVLAFRTEVTGDRLWGFPYGAGEDPFNGADIVELVKVSRSTQEIFLPT